MDPIISRFKELDFAVDTSERLKFLDRGDTNNESDEEHDVRESSAGVAMIEEMILNERNNGSVYSHVLNQCESALQTYTDLLKLEMITTKSWYISALYDSVLIRFNLKDNNNLEQTDEFFKDLALKSIKKCDKSAVGLESLYTSISSFRDFIASSTSGLSDMSPLLSNSMTLLFEIWVVTNREIRHFQKVIAGIFMRSKLLLIDYELVKIWNLVRSKDKNDSTNIDKENVKKLETTITSYRAFLKIFIAQLQDAECSNQDNSNQDAFEECLRVFFDIESMYQALNFNWLLKENKHLQDKNKMLDDKMSRSLPTINESKEVHNITAFVDDFLQQPPVLQIPMDSKHTKTASASSSISSTSSYPFSPTSKSYHSLSTTSDDEKSPYPFYFDGNSSDRFSMKNKNYTINDSSSTLHESTMSKVADRESETDTDSDMYLMMEKTNLSKELPKLLNAFSNAKKLEQEIKTAKSTSAPSSSQESIRESQDNSSEKQHSPSPNNLSRSQLLSNSIINKTLLDKKKEDLMHNMDNWVNHNNIKFSTLPTGLGNPLYTQLNNTHTKPHGFKSNFLNNLYGLGHN
ncbi:uncharacterized protein GVI51_K07733 [Nakaseomyces glabratus]|uniref:Mitochondrial distribution and morphology protein 36 n=1 Tax=Candida glabrata (strain ATCC 2001 / BCRC 20586 / JCM 3761 / NBRC 0622 / NRRL Y-65 / CBS 138) TaxID=284593 RepID=Q6FMI1_CANGA|nr:uncharacterized protein CAGL0K07876g [Nakaseomyces glabratus]KAH7597128.1 hypothetical protein J7294_03862 [Nakaseomyces glabratus]KAH7602900.1 hypothetical protein J7293_03855 [Nakaseomyces glabratus]QHS68226.1 uncharacterized protein GVI51_K07733 [Nakaseomyces glabratus]CAG61526.1 unnamed protein product [Nakaseomyces glabratus]|eukprot:XP_448563.1 uncharacterized protein CAGL0K07876g [[Candida] glabrata]